MKVKFKNKTEVSVYKVKFAEGKALLISEDLTTKVYDLSEIEHIKSSV